ncbi:asphd2 [Symbiodinium natans]|uniref:Asphd2 protein n=1 Tax=Symbiodinium natans TaxID=878477 RepID=A0A812K6E3_9DINO|nr:asphd2 [Symbiodinium natans]
MDWLARNHRRHPRRKELMEKVSQRMFQLGLTPSPHQWTERLNEQLTPFVLMDPETQSIPWPGPASALSWLAGNFSTVILPAFSSASKAGAWEEHDEGLHNAGHWELAWIWREDECQAKWHPEVCRLVEDVQAIWPTREALLSARFSRMNPNTEVMEHTSATNQRIKIHCGVHNPSNVTMYIADKELTWRRGHCFLLDDSYGHRLATAATDEPRTILEIKIYHPDLAWADCLDDDGGLEERTPRSCDAGLGGGVSQTWERTALRSWNIHISQRDLRAHRRDSDLAAGGVVYGNGFMRLFSGSHLLCTGYFYAFKIDAVDDEHFPLDSLRDMSLAFGVSHLPGGHKLGIRSMYAYEIPGTILVGYGRHIVDSGEWFTQSAWDPKSLVVGDVVGVHINPLGDLVVWVNGEQVLRTVTSLTEGNRNELNPRRKALGPRRTLFPVIDLHGRVSAVTLLPEMSMPNLNLKARSKIREKDLNPLGFRGKKAVPVPGRSLPGLGKAVEQEPETLPGFHEL